MRSRILATVAAGVTAAALGTTPALAQDVPTTDPTDPNPVSLGHFDVKVAPGADAPQDSLAHYEVTTCAKNLAAGEKVRVSWDPWTMVNVDGQEFAAGAYEGGNTADDYPYADGAEHNGANDTERFIGNGECATGQIAFAPVGQGKQIVYSNGYGEKAIWNLDS